MAGVAGTAGAAAAVIMHLALEHGLGQEVATILPHIVEVLLVQDHPQKLEIVTANVVSNGGKEEQPVV